MINGDKGESRLNYFIFISLVIHAIIFLLFPQLSEMYNYGADGPGQGGIIQVIYSPSNVNSVPSPITDPRSTAQTPQVEQPRPTNEPAQEVAAAIPVQPESTDNILPPSQPRSTPIEVGQPERPEVVETVPEPPPVTSEVISSETGREVFVDSLEQIEPEAIEPSQIVVNEPRPDLDLESTPEHDEPNDQDFNVSGTGADIVGTDSDGLDGIVESGMGEAEIAPPPPPPLPSGSSVLNIAGNGGVSYPKNAQDDRTEGVVILEIIVNSSGQVGEATVIESSGDSRLDNQARLTFLNTWEFRGAELDYIIGVSVDFSLEHGIVVSPIYIRWAE